MRERKEETTKEEEEEEEDGCKRMKDAKDRMEQSLVIQREDRRTDDHNDRNPSPMAKQKNPETVSPCFVPDYKYVWTYCCSLLVAIMPCRLRVANLISDELNS